VRFWFAERTTTNGGLALTVDVALKKISCSKEQQLRNRRLVQPCSSGYVGSDRTAVATSKDDGMARNRKLVRTRKWKDKLVRSRLEEQLRNRKLAHNRKLARSHKLEHSKRDEHAAWRTSRRSIRAERKRVRSRWVRSHKPERHRSIQVHRPEHSHSHSQTSRTSRLVR
jgi:hypothetical protein